MMTQEAKSITKTNSKGYPEWKATILEEAEQFLRQYELSRNISRNHH